MTRPWRFLTGSSVAPGLLEAVMGKGFALIRLGRVEEALQFPGFTARLKELV
jgi:hypothetical protein